MDIIFTRYAGDECARILYEQFKQALEKRFSGAYLACVGEVKDHLDTKSTCEILDRFGAVYREVSEGGVLRTLFEMAMSEKCGMTVDEDLIPIHQETIEIAEVFDINPYASLSTGSVVAFTERSEEVLSALHEAGIPAVKIGRTEPGKKKTLLRGGEPQCMNRPKKDPLKDMEALGELL